jgi:Domain of unknown function (DUF4259)
MGLWGTSIFANDLAADVRDGVVYPLRQFVRDYFATVPDHISLEDFEEDMMGEVIPRLALIAVLCEQCQAVPPPLEDVQTWGEQYRAQDAAVGESPEEYRIEVEELFGRLERLAKDRHGESSEPG